MFPLSDSIKTPRIPIVNILIIVGTIFVFFKEITAPDFESFIRTYALIPSTVDFLDFATLMPFVTSIFLHGGLLHISSNMWFLWVFGDNVETHFKWYLYPILYLSAGVIGNVVQFALMRDSSIPMLGASGAVAGALGAYYQLFPFSRIRTLVLLVIFPIIIEIPALIMLGYWFFLQLFAGAASISITSPQEGGIAFFAHIGGFLTGIFFAKLFKNSNTSE